MAKLRCPKCGYTEDDSRPHDKTVYSEACVKCAPKKSARPFERRDAALRLREAVAAHEPNTYWGPDGAQMSRNEILALLDVEKAARAIAVWASQLDGNATRIALHRLDEVRRAV